MCDIARYIVTSCPVPCDVTRYQYIEISYIYPEFLGLIWRYRIPSINFSMPDTIFCQFGAPSLVHLESKRNDYLAIELQKPGGWEKERSPEHLPTLLA